MKLVLLSGGSGKRLWPLSNDSRSKQFLKVLANDEGELESMVQRVWGQLEAAGLSNDAVIATSKAQVEMLQNHLGPEVPIVVEPARRDTFPAIALAAVYLYSVEGVSLQETVAILPVDPFVDKAFFDNVHKLGDVLLSSGAELVLMGVSPTYPSEKYGYIVTSEKASGQSYYEVSHFKEKPTEKEATKLIEQNALWNCGVFAFRLDYIISYLERNGYPIQYEALSAKYHRLNKISFDYEIVEKTKRIVAVPYEGYWKDLGTWNTLTEEMDTQLIGKGIMNDCVNTHLINELDLPVAVIGITNAVVAVSPDGILVSDKALSPKIKELSDEFDRRPMQEERRWGSYRVLDYSKFEDEEVLTRRIHIEEGKNLSYQVHYHRTETWTVLKGEGLLILNGQASPIHAGDLIQITPGTMHAVKAFTDLHFIEVQSGSQLVEEDIHRICMTWEEIMSSINS